MKKRQIFIALACLQMSLYGFAQSAPELSPLSIKGEDVELFNASAYSGNVTIKQGAEVAELVGVRMAILKKQKGIEGYRIRIFAKTGAGARTEADDLRVNFRETHAHTKPYLRYNSPNWEIHVGNCRTKMEAMEILDVIKAEYPQAFIIKSVIEFPELKTKKSK